MNKLFSTRRADSLSRRVAVSLATLLLAACVLSCGSIRVNNASAESAYVDQPMVEDREMPNLDEMEVHEDFAEMFELNNDLVGWLTCGKEIELPITQYDNIFYLDHDFYGKEDEAGTVFINEANFLWPQDKNVLFHGHNMKSGASFGNLDDYRELDYLKEYPIVSFRTIYDEDPTVYVPVALFDASMNADNKDYFDIGRITFKTDDEFVAFANDCIAHSIFQTPFDVKPEDTLITLITCSYSNDNGRFMIVCRALRDDESILSVSDLMQQATAK